jgi:hypothetical protein
MSNPGIPRRISASTPTMYGSIPNNPMLFKLQNNVDAPLMSIPSSIITDKGSFYKNFADIARLLLTTRLPRYILNEEHSQEELL